MKISFPQFDVVQREYQYVLVAGEEPVLAPDGQEILYPTPRVPEFMQRACIASETTTPAGLPVELYVRLRRLSDAPESDPLLRPTVSSALFKSDPFLDKSAFERALCKHDDVSCVERIMEDANQVFLLFNGLATAVRAFHPWRMELAEGRLESDQDGVVSASLILADYEALTLPERAVLQALCALHACGLILPLLLLRKRLSPSEYVNALFGLHHPQQEGCEGANARFAADMLEFPARLVPSLPAWDRIRESWQILLREVWAALDFSLCARINDAPPARAAEIIRQGESFSVEFKSTLRWNINAARKDPAIEHASLKTINAFLNSSGGTLIIGVRDDGTPTGLELDQFANEDKMSLHFWNLVKTSMGQEVAPFVRATFETVSGCRVLLVQCARSPRPVFLQQKNPPEEEFYIRLGPSSAKLSVREALQYVAQHFPDKTA